MLCFPNAKINIGLNILERRPDQFHNIESLFYPVPLSDILEIIVNPAITHPEADLRVSGLQIEGTREDNLCTRAYRLMAAKFQLPPVKIILHKIIPMGAGLGGGSSDGANTILLLNKMFGLGLDRDGLTSFADELGSDCSFFIDNQPAIGTGKGNVLTRSLLQLSGNYLVIVKPSISVSTAEAYAGIHPSRSGFLLKELVQKPIREWKDNIFNDFEKTIFMNHPEIKEIKDHLYHYGALYASMTGSGSAVYALFEQEIRLKESFPGMFYWGGWL
jgi:4-diphosphocytidyl-2-C-methyl-D-erythritol kinase